VRSLILDAGAIAALDRNDRLAWALLRAAAEDDLPILVPSGAIARAWSEGASQPLLARALTHCDEIALDGPAARAAGVMARTTGITDVLDASVAVTIAAAARTGEVVVVTDNAKQVERLLQFTDADPTIIEV
jgi:hypothetical protein